MEKVLFLFLAVISFPGLAQNPAWQKTYSGGGSFSSPKSVDLNNDGFEDIVLGAGREDSSSVLGVLAINGRNGDTLWTIPSRNQIYTSAVFEDIDGDSIPDIFIGGRRALLFCLSGVSGQKIWEFWPDHVGRPDTAGWYNFYSPFLIQDITGDGRRDIIITNGGDPGALGGNPDRPAGSLLAINSSDGSIIQMDSMPDGAETYFSPLVLDHDNDGLESIFFGSGGETLPGGFWEIGLQEFLNNGLSNANLIDSDTNKGFIAVCSFADLNGDGVFDPIVPHMNSKLTAYDGSDFSTLWEHFVPGTEVYMSPVPGNFTSNLAPDIYVSFAVGVWPFYTSYVATLIDGGSGQLIWSDTLQYFHLASPNALDYDQDGFDEILFMENVDQGSTTVSIVNRWKLYDFSPFSFQYLGGIRPGSNLFSTPLIKDMNKDGELEIGFNFYPATIEWYGFESVGFGRWDIGIFQDPVPWGGYLGSFGDGTYRNNLISQLKGDFEEEIFVYPNPVRQSDEVLITTPFHQEHMVRLFDQAGKQLDKNAIKRGPNLIAMDVSDLKSGFYILLLENGWSKKLLIIGD